MSIVLKRYYTNRAGFTYLIADRLCGQEEFSNITFRY